MHVVGTFPIVHAHIIHVHVCSYSGTSQYNGHFGEGGGGLYNSLLKRTCLSLST